MKKPKMIINLRHKIYLNILLMLKSNLLFAFFGLTANIILARFYGADLKGEFVMIMLLSSIISLSARLGLDTYLIRFQSGKVFRDKDRGETLITLIISFVAILSILLILLFLSMILEFKLLDDFSKNFVPIMTLSIIELLSIILSAYFIANNPQVYRSSIIIQPLIFLVLLSTTTAFSDDSTVLLLIDFVIISFIVKLLYLIFKYPKILNIFNNFICLTSKKERSFKIVKFSIKSHGGNILDFLLARLDILAVFVYLGTTQVGIYSIAALAEKINIFSTSIGMSVLGDVDHRKNYNLNNKLIYKTLFISMILYLFSVIMSYFFLTKLFGIQFSDALIPFTILAFGYSVLAIAKPMKAYILINGNPLIFSYSSLLSIIINIILILSLVRNYGLIGVAFSTATSNIFYTIFISYYYYKLIKSKSLNSV